MATAARVTPRGDDAGVSSQLLTTGQWLRRCPVGPSRDDAPVPHDHPITHGVPGGMDRVRNLRPLLNGREVPPGVHHDVQHPIPVVATLRWETGDEQLDTVALEWWTTRAGTVVRVRVADQRIPTGAVWLPVEDVRPAPNAARPARAERSTTMVWPPQQ